MATILSLVVAYLLGGITFIPLVVLAVLAHAHYTFPYRDGSGGVKGSDGTGEDDLVLPGDDISGLEAAAGKEGGKEKEPYPKMNHDVDVSAGYFAVCREYTPMGINAKPIERTTPIGPTTVAAPSPSVYQTMYRSIFERKSNAGPLENANNPMSSRPKKAGNVFYVVLRHGHLMLFDDEEQHEVRHVISLAHHDVSIYSGGDVTPEGELFIKRNAICLSRRTDAGELAPDTQISKPFYLFSENCSAKEDFYFALLRNQEHFVSNSDDSNGNQDRAPKPKSFEVKNIISLVQSLHSGAVDENVHSRWLNAMIGRIFLGIYQTQDLENYIREKINKKISRVKKPSFLTSVELRKIHPGDAAPILTNFKLKDLNVEGECVVEADVKYSGRFRVEIAAAAKIDLGPRFKPREVNFLLAVLLRKLKGHIILKIKPPPSNRIWFSFQTMPQIDMDIEPIVSSRQITYAVILRTIENRIKEVVAETLVQPFWDDVPFFRTEHKKWRGGIFEGDDAVVSTTDPEEVAPQNISLGKTDKPEEKAGTDKEDLKTIKKSHSMPLTDKVPEKKGEATGRKPRKDSKTSSLASASSTSVDLQGLGSPGAKSPTILKDNPMPVIAMDPSNAELFKPSSSPPDHATNYMAALASRSQEVISDSVPVPDSPPKQPTSSDPTAGLSDTSKDEEFNPEDSSGLGPSFGRRNTTSSAESASHDETEGSDRPASMKSQTGSLGRSFFRRENTDMSTANLSGGTSPQGPKRNTLSAVTNAAAQAKQWGWNAIQRQREARKNGAGAPDLTLPMGRGQPLPPPGTPLPGPNGKVMPPKRKPVGESSSYPYQQTQAQGHSPRPDSSTFEQSRRSSIIGGAASTESLGQERPTLPQRRRRGDSHDVTPDDSLGMLVVAAPDDESLPNSPADEKEDYLTSLDIVHELGITVPSEGLNPEPKESSESKASSIVESEEETTTTAPVKGNFDGRHSSASILSPQLPITSEQISHPIVAMPAVVTPEEDDDDLSGWLDEETQEGQAESTQEDTISPTAKDGGVKEPLPLVPEDTVPTVSSTSTNGREGREETDAYQAARLAMMH